MIDGYTKAMLTIIAVSLLALALQSLSPRATAQVACGNIHNPVLAEIGHPQIQNRPLARRRNS